MYTLTTDVHATFYIHKNIYYFVLDTYVIVIFST